jgi:hypothetical protein
VITPACSATPIPSRSASSGTSDRNIRVPLPALAELLRRRSSMTRARPILSRTS